MEGFQEKSRDLAYNEKNSKQADETSKIKKSSLSHKKQQNPPPKSEQQQEKNPYLNTL